MDNRINSKQERYAEINRITHETSISMKLWLDGAGESKIATGIGFFDHMLTLLAKHGLLDVELTVKGDLEVDGHHTVEDVGIVLGQALAKALVSKDGIKRYGSAFVPMDEALVLVALDFGGRPYLVYEVEVPSSKVGNFDTELVQEFLQALAVNAAMNIHVRQFSGINTHHIIEAVFKALGQAIRAGATYDQRIKGVMSTKGTI
ncbi:MAG: imidazoleglycerol-phosphate dehydratase HisB [Bacillota bacterium]|nr:imidazoleglycerol-phosphate dehydratase HisB [Bacillota bacterium]